jgi:hypothetical protein
MIPSLAERLSSLPHLGRDALCQLWQELLSSPPPAQLRRDFMIPILAHRLQQEGGGRLSGTTLKRIAVLARSVCGTTKPSLGLPSHLRPGTRLVRQWAGGIHVVNVERSGYEYKGTRYRSLSQIARLITGTRWSGPLFFGLKGKRSDKNSTMECE